MVARRRMRSCIRPLAAPHLAGSFLKEKEKREELKMRAYERQQKEMKELRAEINSLRKIESAAASVRCQMARVEPHSRRSVAQRGVAG